ncbi:MAG: PAS domain-containing protein, partial [Rhodocyclaceae bacterium]|nr:PAS domain-containing protein [Rhodocyclaceae bacterium]
MKNSLALNLPAAMIRCLGWNLRSPACLTTCARCASKPPRGGGEVDALKAEIARIQETGAVTEERLALVLEASDQGLWDIVITGEPFADNYPFNWSNTFRRMLGFNDERDFPNVLGSWTSRLHPDDLNPTLAAFARHVEDTSGQTPYDVTYRLKLKSGEYRWFRA